MKTVIIAHNQFDLVVKQIMDLLTNGGRKFGDIIVIDNFSDDELGSYLKSQKDIDYIICDDKLESYADILDVVISEFAGGEDIMVITPGREGYSAEYGVLLTTEMIGRIENIGAIDDRFFREAPDTQLLSDIDKGGVDEFSVLEVGCGLGVNLRYIKEACPRAALYGMETNAEAAKVAGIFGAIAAIDMSGDDSLSAVKEAFGDKKFDYIVFSGSLAGMQNTEQTLSAARSLLAPGGKILASVPNGMYFKTLRSLLSGTFMPIEPGNAKRDRVSSFGSYDLAEMFCGNGLYIEKTAYAAEELSENDEVYVESLMGLSSVADKLPFTSKLCRIVAVEDEARAREQLDTAREKVKDGAMIVRLAQNAKRTYRDYAYGKRLNAFKGRGVIYTVLTGGYDELNDPEYVDGQFDYICFTDDPDLRSDIWQIRLVENPEGLDKTRLARKHKILCHKYLEDYDYSVYIDAKLKIIGDMSRYIEEYSKGSSMLCFPHHLQDCLYEEAEACKFLGKDDYGVMSRQIEGYRQEGFPEHYGMIDTACLVRLHSDKALCALMESWWDEIKNKSKRDQLSFEYVCWKNDFHYDLCDLFIYKNNYILKRRSWEKSVE